VDTVSSKVSARELREHLSEVVGRVSFGGERIGVTRNGRLTAVIMSVSDAEALEAYEDSADLNAYLAWAAAGKPSRPAGDLWDELEV